MDVLVEVMTSEPTGKTGRVAVSQWLMHDGRYIKPHVRRYLVVSYRQHGKRQLTDSQSLQEAFLTPNDGWLGALLNEIANYV